MRRVRRSQFVVPFGVGSILEFEDEALMPAALDTWNVAAANRIYDDRLASRLGVQFFVTPAAAPEQGAAGDGRDYVLCVRFPRWHFCPRCRALQEVDLHANRAPRCDNLDPSPRLNGRDPCGRLAVTRRLPMLPVRFLAACPRGHIEDFPWHAWAHSSPGADLADTEKCLPASLSFFATRKAGLGGLVVQCRTCEAKRSLFGSTDLRGWRCRGQRPWLGADKAEECPDAAEGGARNMVTLQRGASNVYFPEVTSSILIPPFSGRVMALLSDPEVAEALRQAEEEGEIRDMDFRYVAAGRGVSWEELKSAYESRGQATAAGRVDEVSFRFQELSALETDRRVAGDALTCRTQKVESYGPWVRDNFAGVTLVERLTETRALVGFSRIEPGRDSRAALSREFVNWRPGFRVQGEGIFLSFHPDRLAEFERTETRAQRLVDRAGSGFRTMLPISTRLILIHSFAHLLIKRLSYDAGYGASSIRERIYAAPAEGQRRAMAGVLLYTAAGDAEGTLGGLVELGRQGALEAAVAGALEDARWCASDPVCMESNGQGPDSLNLAACHACVLLPETSCELQNRYLDRGVVNRFFTNEA